jgi:hypothetical protein
MPGRRHWMTNGEYERIREARRQRLQSELQRGNAAAVALANIGWALRLGKFDGYCDPPVSTEEVNELSGRVLTRLEELGIEVPAGIRRQGGRNG